MTTEAAMWRALALGLLTVCARQNTSLELAYEYLLEGHTSRSKREIRAGLDPLCLGWVDCEEWKEGLALCSNGSQGASIAGIA